VAVRTNLLYDAFLVPALGVEWRPSRGVGVKFDGAYCYWGSEHGRVQKMWLADPEIRWYPLPEGRFHVGLGANFGEYNLYRGIVGGLLSTDTGYQGNLWGGGVTLGYQLRLSGSLSLDVSLGLGYIRFAYDSFVIMDGTRVYKDKAQTKNMKGLTQAGISLVWTI
jgi:hypothetical protein